MDYFDILLAKKLSGGGGGNITVEPITITENGMTTAPTGKAYSPIYTDVTLPDNAYLLKEVEDLPKDIATFTDGSALPMPSLKTTIVPIQDLHGYDSPWAGGAGKNKFDKDNANVFNGYIAGGKVIANSNHRCIYIPCKPNTTYTVQKIAVANGDQDRFSVGYCDVLPANNVDCYDIQSVTVSTIVAGTLLTLTITTGANASYLILWVSTATYYSQSIATTQIEEGSTATSFAPYSNICPISGHTEGNVTVADDVDNPTVTHTYTIPFLDAQGNPIDVFGGELDVVNGGGSAYKEYDSYNGETLTGPWISDRDVYVPNTSPTIGAQVVDMGDTSTFTSQPTSIKSIEGVNNVWCDTGDIEELSYFSKPSEG